MIVNLVALLTCVVALAVGLRALMRSASRRPLAGATVCAGCGASAAGMETFQCPSCHADVRVKGLVRPGARAASRFWFAMAWTLAMAAVVVGIAVSRQFRGGAALAAETEFAPTTIQATALERLVAKFEGTAEPRGVLWIDLYRNDGVVRTLEVSLPDRAARSVDERGAARSYGTFDADTFGRWLDEQGVGDDVRRAHGDKTGELFQDIDGMIQWRRAGGNSVWSRGGSVSVSGGEPGPAPLLAALVSLAWLIVLLWLLRRGDISRVPKPFAEGGAVDP